MFVGYADDHTGDVYGFIHIIMGKTVSKQRCEMVKYYVECIYEKVKKIKPESGRKWL